MCSSELFDNPHTAKSSEFHLPLAAQLVCHCRVHSYLLTDRRIAKFQSRIIGVVPSTAGPGDFICSGYKYPLLLVLRGQQGVYEHFDQAIMTEFGNYYKAQMKTPVEMANYGLRDIDIPFAADAKGLPNPSHVSYIGECFHARQGLQYSFCIPSIFVIH